MKILIADDCFDWLKHHTKEIKEAFNNNVKIIIANSANEAINIYKNEIKISPFDLVITDLQMEKDFEPLSAGEWLIREIQELNYKQNILVVSSHFNIDIIANNYSVNYLSKRHIVSDNSVFKSKIKNIINT